MWFVVFRTDCATKFGMEDGTILDAQITASSKTVNSVSTYSAYNSRLNKPAQGFKSAGGWCAAVSDLDQWLKVDLGAVRPVSGIMMQGRDGSDKRVVSYTVSHHNGDDSMWENVKDSSGVEDMVNMGHW